MCLMRALLNVLSVTMRHWWARKLAACPPAAWMASESSPMVTCSPVATTTSCSRSLGRWFTACTSFSSRFVSPDIAETTTTRSCPAARAWRHLRATARMRSGSATDVPPYFWTHSATLACSSMPLPAAGAPEPDRWRATCARTLDGEPRARGTFRRP